MKASNDNYFVELSKINVNEHVERKGQFSYLSWPFAVSQLRQFDPVATWQVLRFDGLPYLMTDLGVFVEVAVCVKGVSLSQIHPVLDSKNRPILAPTAFDINTSIQRCLVKAIALHGLGLYLYSGEDLPLASDEPKAEVKPVVPEVKTVPPTAATPIRQGKAITIGADRSDRAPAGRDRVGPGQAAGLLRRRDLGRDCRRRLPPRGAQS
jgi:hypothetical protein